MNAIANLKTMNLHSAEGPVTAIVMGVNIRDPQTADTFIQEVAEKFKVQRMCSPPDTSVMLITLVSEMPAARFVERWRQLAEEDKILNFLCRRCGRPICYAVQLLARQWRLFHLSMCRPHDEPLQPTWVCAFSSVTRFARLCPSRSSLGH